MAAGRTRDPDSSGDTFAYIDCIEFINVFSNVLSLNDHGCDCCGRLIHLDLRVIHHFTATLGPRLYEVLSPRIFLDYYFDERRPSGDHNIGDIIKQHRKVQPS